ncbi:hypothetical protein MHBO_001521, partial [Bonamia ostreae]
DFLKKATKKFFKDRSIILKILCCGLKKIRKSKNEKFCNKIIETKIPETILAFLERHLYKEQPPDLNFHIRKEIKICFEMLFFVAETINLTENLTEKTIKLVATKPQIKLNFEELDIFYVYCFALTTRVFTKIDKFEKNDFSKLKICSETEQILKNSRYNEKMLKFSLSWIKFFIQNETAEFSQILEDIFDYFSQHNFNFAKTSFWNSKFLRFDLFSHFLFNLFKVYPIEKAIANYENNPKMLNFTIQAIFQNKKFAKKLLKSPFLDKILLLESKIFTEKGKFGNAKIRKDLGSGYLLMLSSLIKIDKTSKTVENNKINQKLIRKNFEAIMQKSIKFRKAKFYGKNSISTNFLNLSPFDKFDQFNNQKMVKILAENDENQIFCYLKLLKYNLKFGDSDKLEIDSFDLFYTLNEFLKFDDSLSTKKLAIEIQSEIIKTTKIIENLNKTENDLFFQNMQNLDHKNLFNSFCKIFVVVLQKYDQNFNKNFIFWG